MYSFNLTQELSKIQNNLSREIIKKNSFQKIENIAGADISFEKENIAIAAAVLIDLETLDVLEEKTLKVELLFPYISGFFGLREADATIRVLKSLKNNYDVLMINGHGIMHPRRFGLASHVGLLMNTPSIGIAKQLPPGKYSFKIINGIKYILSSKEVVGAYTNGKYISIGHKISLKSAIDIIFKTSVFKMPEPVRKAHILATETMKNEIS